MPGRVYAGRTTSTRTERIVYCCPCGDRFPAEVYLAVDARQESEAKRLIEGTLNRVRCPSCDARAEVQVPVIFHDGAAHKLVLVLPDGLRHRELVEKAALFASLASDGEPPPAYVLEPAVVFGAAGLRAALAPPPTDGAFESTSDKERLADAAARDTPVVPMPSLPAVPNPRAAVTERWIAGREGPGAFLVENEVLVCASLPAPALEAFVPGHIELRVQLHRLPSYPLITLTLIAGEPGEGGRARPEEARVLSLPLDVARAAHRVVLDALLRRCALAVELYDAEYLLVVTHRLVAPLEENVRRLASEAKDAFDRLAPATRSFERARAQLLSPGYDRLGRTKIELIPDDAPLTTPRQARAALSLVTRWSEPSAEAYLVEIRSFALPRWRKLRARVLKRAFELGLAVPRAFVERAGKELGALPSWPEVLAQSMKRFAEIAAHDLPNDLSAAEEAGNWELLLREAAQAGVAVDAEHKALCAAAQRRARVGHSGGVDLRALGTPELVSLLEQKELRRDAALILCERREAGTLPAVFAAIRRMPRQEANFLLPSVTRFGPEVERWLAEGLRSKKSFLRQGCALALGALKSPTAVDALVRLLVSEPTEIWTEVARALGDAGLAAVAPLSAQVQDADGDGVDRIVEALAHVAARGGVMAHTAIEALAQRDGMVAEAAERALAKVAEVRAADAEVRRGQQEATVVRGFSRRFYDVLRGEGNDSRPVELSPADLEEVEDEDFEPTDEKMITHTDIPVLMAPEESTAPNPKSTLPRGRS